MIKPSTLTRLGFDRERVTEEEFFYDMDILTKNDSVLDITTEYDTDGTFANQCVELNGEKLQGNPIDERMLIRLIDIL